MKEIPFTTEHKTKLIEMCKVLFPEYTEISVHGSNIYFDTIDYINWFQFVLIYLLPKLDVRENMFVTLAIHQVKPYSGCAFTHPIDYLYKKFQKQIKNEN